MQTIELHATPQQDYRLPETVELQVITPLQQSDINLDDSLALVLQVVRQSHDPHAMDALATLLAYMESLERQQAALTSVDTWVTLENPITMSL